MCLFDTLALARKHSKQLAAGDCCAERYNRRGNDQSQGDKKLRAKTGRGSGR